MATNNNEQTLFRFVSLRNPQLTETKDKNLGFIHRPSHLKSTFDSAINPADTALVKFQALERAAKNFNPGNYKTELQIEEGQLSEALKIGRKISKKTKLSITDETTAKTLYNSSNIQAKMSEVWDNLMYQTVTQSNFYVKEALIHILKALHFGYVCDLAINPELTKINGEDLKAKAIDARVVLPMKFFGDGYEGESSKHVLNGNAFQVNVSKIGEGVINGTQLPIAVREQLKSEGEKISYLTTLTHEKESLTLLRLELEKLEKIYSKLKVKAYDQEYEKYQKTYQPLLDRFEAAREAIEAKVTEEMTKEEIAKLYSKLEQPNIPPFVFNYKNEINFDDLKERLSLESLKLFVDNFTALTVGVKPDNGFDFSTMTVISERKLQLGEVTVSIIDEFDTYIEIFEKLNELTSSKTQELFSKVPKTEQTYANIGGVLIPVNINSSAARIVSRSYYLMANQNWELSRFSPFITFYYQAESTSWGTATANVKIISDVGNFEENYSNIEIIDNKVTFPPLFVNKFGKSIRNIQIKIYFSNGKNAYVEHSMIELNTPITGLLYSEETKDETENPGGGQEEPKPGVFIPRHFGVKRLGVADYLKVVQSTHAYVPGEVTHIENIMAKEFKQKSTRRLRRSEIQTTTSKSTERETLSDTTSTTRNDMQSEVANIIQSQINAEAHFRYGGNGLPYEVGGGFATNNSKETSTRQAIAKSQEITEKASERILTKVAEERIEKIIEEFEENNAHGFDNRNGDKHVVGVYRWVDKKMKNQIYNYGKRTMFEFMIPEPARLHKLATFVTKNTLTEPIDPRKAPEPNGMKDSTASTDEKLLYWADYFGITLDDTIKKNIVVNHKAVGSPQNEGNATFSDTDFNIPDDYSGKTASIVWSTTRQRRKSGFLQGNYIMASGITFSNLSGGNFYFSNREDGMGRTENLVGLNLTGTQNFKVSGGNIGQFNFNITVNCTLNDAYLARWRKEQFDKIIKAYEEAYANFLVKQKEAEEKAKEDEEKNKEKMGNFYRDMERVILKHNCIAYLLQDYLVSLGQQFTDGDQMSTFQVLLSDELEQYSALAKFMEQAFEWTIMDYSFYPYYWGDRKKWQEMYLSESTDPLFRSFLQAGMARVIVTVNPGFEDAVQFFMSTGRIWNGGEVPVIGDPMYMSIVDEMREPLGLKQGKAWITTLPTSLNILQKDSAGLVTTTALPFTQENPDEFEVPSDVVTETEFSIVDSQLNSGDDKFVDNIELNNGFLQLTTDDNPKEIVAQLPLSDLKQALQ